MASQVWCPMSRVNGGDVRGFVWLAAVGGVAMAAETVRSTTWLRVRRLDVALPGLPSEWVGVRIAHLSDFHIGARGTSRRVLRRARTAALRFRPDIVALTGDYFDHGRIVADDGLLSGWPDGASVFAVLGNHDFRGSSDAPQHVVDALHRGGARVLRNEAVGVPLRGRTAWVVGVDDPFTRRSREAEAFATVPESDDALLFLAHSPSIDDTTPLGRARIMLCGHTHGGQVRLLPSGRIPLVRLVRRLLGTPPRREPSVYRGAHWLRGMLVVVSDGLGVSRLPLRWRTRPEVVLIELCRIQVSGPPCDTASRYVTRRTGRV